MQPFIYDALPMRVVFGPGTIAQVRAEVERLGAKRALVLTTPYQTAEGERVAALLGPLAAGIFSGATMHTPTHVTDAALAQLKASDAQCVVAIGGGSTTGLGKALAVRTGVDQVVIPTTYAGSEMTPILGETAEGAKTTRRDPAILPETVIYDVDLTMGLPVPMSGVSGMNAIAHAVEALYAENRNPIVSMMAEDAIRALGSALPKIKDKADDRGAREDALYGAWLGGVCLGAVGMALHHKLCHTLGGMFDLPHAETHTIILPHAAAYNAPSTPEAMARTARALGVDDAPRGLYDLSGRIGAKRALRDIGMPEDGIERAADAALRNPYWNPRPLEAAAIRSLIAAAWRGDPPGR